MLHSPVGLLLFILFYFHYFLFFLLNFWKYIGSPFNLGLNFSMVQIEKFHQGEVIFEQVGYFFCMLQKCILCSFNWIFCKVFVQKFPKNANYYKFLTKFVNTNNHIYSFLHGLIILHDAKNCSQHAKIFDAWQKLTFCRVDKKA